MSLESWVDLVTKPDSTSLQTWMRLGASGEDNFDLISRKDLDQRFALSPYIQMVRNGIGEKELLSRIWEDIRAYIEEYVLKTKIGVKEFILRNGDLYSDNYGEETFLTICRKTVLAREQQGLPVERARHEGLGVANIVKLLEVASVGQVVVLISPPYEPKVYGKDKPYSMVYLYQKQENGRVWFGAVRDDDRTIQEWQKFARDECMWQTDCGEYDDLKFVALPIVAKKELNELLHDLGVSGVEQIPDWMEREARLTAKVLASNLVTGSNNLAQRALDAFKIVIVAGRQQTAKDGEGLSVSRAVLDPRYGWMMYQMFINGGGDKILAAGGMCGGDGLVGEWGGRGDYLLEQNPPMNNLISMAYGVDENNITRMSRVSSSGSEIHVTLPDGTTYVLKIREGWVCKGEGCSRVSSQSTGVRIGECHICEYCDPNVHRAN